MVSATKFSQNILASTVLQARADTLRQDLNRLADKGITEGPGVEAARDLLALLEKAGTTKERDCGPVRGRDDLCTYPHCPCV